MAKLPSQFDSSQHADMMDFSLIKDPGPFEMAIQNSEMRQTSSKDGEYLWLEIEIMDGPYKGRKLWRNLNLINKSEKAVEIAQRELASICRACKIGEIDDSEDLHNIIFSGTLGIKKSKNKDPDQQVITKYEPLVGAATPIPPSEARASSGKGKDKATSSGTERRTRKPVFEEDDEEE